LTARRIRRPESRKRENKTLPDAAPVLSVETNALSPEAMKKEENDREVSAPRRSFFEAAAAECLRHAQSLQPKLTAEEDDRTWDRALGRAILPRKVKRQEEEIKKLKEQINTPHVTRTPVLTDREKNIWNVIQRMSKGRQYCREVDGAGIEIQRKGVWKGAPPTYIAAYDAGKPWRHRIEDEKSKIKRKAKLAKLASE
jgi:hypothetical protein